MNVGDKITWDTVNGLISGVIKEVRGDEYLVSYKDKVVIVHESSIRNVEQNI